VYFRDEINQSLTLQFAEAAGKRRAEGLPIVSLGLGEPDFDTPPEFIQAVSSVLSKGNSKYSSPNGVQSLRNKIAEKLQHDNAKNVSVKAGSMSIDLEQLRSEVGPKTKAIIINTPNNPAGFALDQQELESIFNIAEQFDSYIISDEVYEKLTFSQNAHISIGSLEPAVKRVITINGFSKSHALTGWRLGYACIPSELMSRVTKIQQHMYTNTCTFVQQAVAEAWDFQCQHLDDYLDLLSNRVEQITAWIDRVPELSYIPPKSGFFAFISIESLGVSSNEFCAGLLSETGVATTPGLAFGADWDDHFRVSFAVSNDDLQKGLAGISSYIGTLQSKTNTAQGQLS